MEYFSAIRKDEYPTFVSTWTGLEEIMLSELSQQRESITYGFPYLWSIRNNTEDMGRWRGEGSWGKLEGEMNHESLWTLRNKLRVLEGKEVGGWVSLAVGIKEGTYCMDHWVWRINNEFWNAHKKIIELNFKNKLFIN